MPCSIPGSGRSPGIGNSNPLQYSCLEKSHGWRNLVGYSPWGHKESDTTERLHFLFFLSNPHWTGFVFLNISVTIILYVCFLVIDNKSPLNITIHFTVCDFHGWTYLFIHKLQIILRQSRQIVIWVASGTFRKITIRRKPVQTFHSLDDLCSDFFFLFYF